MATMTNVRMNVAMSGSTPSTPTFAKIAVKAANTADKSAQPCQPIAAISCSSVLPLPVTVDHADVPEVTLGFWVIKILATTLGETGGDTVTMTMDLGYMTGSAIFLLALIVLVGIQIAAKRFHPFLYWSVIVASTTAGTTMADFATRSLGIGYTGGSLILFASLMAVLGLWYWSQGSVWSSP